jgi:hypothetical protein
MRPVALFRQFHGLSKYIKFVKFGVVDFKLFKFEFSISREIGINRNSIFEFSGLGGNAKWAKRAKRLGPAQQCDSHTRAA